MVQLRKQPDYAEWHTDIVPRRAVACCIFYRASRPVFRRFAVYTVYKSMARRKDKQAAKRTPTPPSKQAYTVRLTNVQSGTQEELRLPSSARGRNEYSLWPAFTAYVIGFGLLGLSFIAHTLKLYWVFGMLLAMSAGIVFGTVTVRFFRRG